MADLHPVSCWLPSRARSSDARRNRKRDCRGAESSELNRNAVDRRDKIFSRDRRLRPHIGSAVMSSSARARSVALPIATLGELLAHDFEIHVWCPRCHEFRRPTIPAERLRHKFAGARFRCRCGAPDYPSFRPSPHTREETERHDHRPVRRVQNLSQFESVARSG